MPVLRLPDVPGPEPAAEALPEREEGPPSAAAREGERLTAHDAPARRPTQMWRMIWLVGLSLAVFCMLLPLFGQVSGRYRLVPVLGDSMRPALERGDLAWTSPVKASAVRVGDVIVFDSPPTPEDPGSRRVIHRVTTILAGPELARATSGRPGSVAVLTKGDANPAADGWHLVLNDRAWRQDRVFPKAGYPLVWARYRLVRGVAGLVLAVALAVAIVPTVRRSRHGGEVAGGG